MYDVTHERNDDAHTKESKGGNGRGRKVDTNARKERVAKKRGPVEQGAAASSVVNSAFLSPSCTMQKFNA